MDQTDQHEIMVSEEISEACEHDDKEQMQDDAEAVSAEIYFIALYTPRFNITLDPKAAYLV